MPEFSSCQLRIDFEFGSAKGKFMSVAVEHEGKMYPLLPEGTGIKRTTSFEIPIVLPTKIILRFSGKEAGKDTVIDAQGNITEDVSVQVAGLSFDGFKVNEKFLYHKMLLITTDGQQLTTCYAGFNGTITLDFDKQDVFAQYLWMNQ